MRKVLLSLLALTIILGACGNKKEEDSEETGVLPVGDEEIVSDDEKVITINDQDISGDIYNLVYVQTKIQLYNYGQDIEDVDEVKEVSLNTLVEQELLRQAAKDHGINISDEEVEAKFSELMEDSEDQVSEFLNTYKLNEAAFKDQISFSLYLDEYITSEVSVSVSDEEVSDMYEQIKEQNEEIPSFDDIKDNLKADMIGQKEQEEVWEIIKELKEKAEIETHI